MPRNLNRAQKRSRPAPNSAVLHEVLEVLKQQQNSQVPERPDVHILSKPKRDRIYPFTQAYVGPNITTSAVAETDGALSFALSSLPNATALALVFDKYRIKQVRVSFFPYATEAVVTSGTTAGPIYTVFDYDDANAPTIAGLLSYDNLKIAPIGSFFERTLTPRAAIAAYSGVFTSFAQASPNTWFDVASPGVIYYGLKYALPIGSIAGTVLWTTVITVDLEFSHPR